MKRTICWVLEDMRGRYVQHDAVAHFEEFRTITFRSKKSALEWANKDLFWRGRVTPVKAVITVKAYGE